MLEPKRFEHLAGFEGLSERSLHEHLKLYAGYVQRYNELMEKRAALNAFGQTWVASDQESLKVDITFALGAIKNHELFFDSLGADDLQPTGLLAHHLVKSFHSVPQYLIDLKQTAVTGRGWAWTAYDLDLGYLFNYDAGPGNLGGGMPVWNAVPILAIDLYGHAYFYDFGANKVAYVESVMAAISWTRVGQRFAAALNGQVGALHGKKNT